MDVSQLNRSERIAGIGGVLLLIALFLPWYGVTAHAGGISISATATGWEALSFIDILLFLCAVAVIAVCVARLRGAAAALPVPEATVLLAAGALAVLLTLFRLIDVPDGGVHVAGVDVGRRFGIFLAFAAAAAIAYAGREAQSEPI